MYNERPLFVYLAALFNLVLGWSLLAVVLGLNDSHQTSNNNTAMPYWQRPGCYQVGHTRTISIPGCVKFNLSTNACRGYCMSFSIPAPEDIGPPPNLEPLSADTLDGTLVGGAGLAGGQTKLQQYDGRYRAGVQSMPADDRHLLRLLNKDGERDHYTEQQLMDMIIASKRKKSSLVADLSLLPLLSQQATTTTNGDNTNTASNKQHLDKLNTFLHLSGQTRSPLAGTVGDINDKRDVISVGQCCNMVETEDVTVNLRCGFNETRRLVFKSAKTCECFFCKHV